METGRTKTESPALKVLWGGWGEGWKGVPSQQPSGTPPQASSPPEAMRSGDPWPTLPGNRPFRLEMKPSNDFSTFKNNLPPNSNSKETRLRISNKRVMLKSTEETGSVRIIAHSGLLV